ncbi:MAG TPA: hypothetical protein VFK74_05365, partial [Azospira sp.]|nr:hypothetical protein [Azospira sp.]
EGGARLVAEALGGSEENFLWLAIGNGGALNALLAADPGRAAVLITPDTETSPGAYYTLAHPARPAKLRALLQRLLEELGGS